MTRRRSMERYKISTYDNEITATVAITNINCHFTTLILDMIYFYRSAMGKKEKQPLSLVIY